jgi:glycosyltransferase involved in cell wall biosynthesis
MRLHIVSAVFPPEPLMSAQTSRDIALEMTRRGHDVTVFSPFPNRPSGQLVPGARRAWRTMEQRDGYRVIHSWHSLSRRPVLPSRLAENITFGLSSTFQFAREPRPDIVFLNTWPLFSQWLNSWFLSQKEVPIVCAVKDLYPESYMESPRSAIARLVTSIAVKTDAAVYARCRLVAPLNHTMADCIIDSRGKPADEVRVLTDWIDETRFPAKQPKTGRFRSSRKLSNDTFVALYAGSMTHAAGLPVLVDVAEQLRDRRDIHIMLVGDGAMRETLENAISTRGLENISVVSPLDPEDLPQVHAAADVLLLSLSPGVGVHATPSKLISYLFSERPVVASVSSHSESARIIREAGCGYVAQPGDAAELASLFAKLADDPSDLVRLGDKARRYAERRFTKNAVLTGLCDRLEQIVGDPACVAG